MHQTGSRGIFPQQRLRLKTMARFIDPNNNKSEPFLSEKVRIPIIYPIRQITYSCCLFEPVTLPYLHWGSA